MATMVEIDLALGRGIWEVVAAHYGAEPDGATEEQWMQAAKDVGIPWEMVQEMRDFKMPTWDDLHPVHQAFWVSYTASCLSSEIAKSMKQLLAMEATVLTVSMSGGD